MGKKEKLYKKAKESPESLSFDGLCLLVWSNTDESYVATIPEFPGLSAFGITPEEALKEAITSCELFIEDMIEDGEEIPNPSTVYHHKQRELNLT